MQHAALDSLRGLWIVGVPVISLTLLAFEPGGLAAVLPCEALWSQQFGTTDFDRAENIALDKGGNSYLTGITRGNIGGPNAGLDDVFLAKFDESGQLTWSRQLGSPNS